MITLSKRIYYAGIGSRATPDNILNTMKLVALFLASEGFILRSGGVDGADVAFESGVDEIKGDKEIFLPWFNFNGSNSNLVVEDSLAFEMGKKFHPYWDKLSQGAKKLQARNCHQVLGQDLNTPSSFVLCYTERGHGKGGTGQAIRIAKAYDIPVFDFGIPENRENHENLKRFLLPFL